MYTRSTVLSRVTLTSMPVPVWHWQKWCISRSSNGSFQRTSLFVLSWRMIPVTHMIMSSMKSSLLFSFHPYYHLLLVHQGCHLNQISAFPIVWGNYRYHYGALIWSPLSCTGVYSSAVCFCCTHFSGSENSLSYINIAVIVCPSTHGLQILSFFVCVEAYLVTVLSFVLYLNYGLYLGIIPAW